MASIPESQVKAVICALLGKPNVSLSSKSEYRYGQHGSLSINLASATWFDHERNFGGGMIDLVRDKLGIGGAEAADWLSKAGLDLPNSKPLGDPRPVETYSYRDADGTLLFEVVRRPPKRFSQRRPDGNGGWIGSVKGTRRVLYRLPELQAAGPEEPVFIVEGEKDVDTLRSLGLVATTNPGGAGKWQPDFATALVDRRVVILPDNDPPGKAHAEQVEASLYGAARCVALVDLDGLRPKEDVSDWLKAGGNGPALSALAEAALDAAERPVPKGRSTGTDASVSAPTAGDPMAPIPVFRERVPAADIPWDNLGPLRGGVEAIATLTGAPPALAMQAVLGAASLAVQSHADIETLDGRRPISLYLLSVAVSGERKSSCDRLALAGHREVQRQRFGNFRIAQDRHEVARSIYEQDLKAILRQSDPGARAADLETLGDAPQPPLAPTLLVSDATLEGLFRQFAEGQPSVGLFSDEGGQVFGGHAMNRDNRLKTAAGMSRIWDGTAVDRTRAGAPTEHYEGRRLSCHLMLQPIVAEPVFADPVLREQGFLARFLIAWPESRIGYRDPITNEARDRAVDLLGEFHLRVKARLEQKVACSEDGRELCPRVLTLSGEAEALLSAFAGAVEVSQRPWHPCADVRPTASKSAEQAARLAGVLTLWRDPDSQDVDADTMMHATSLADWYLREAQRLFSSGEVSGLASEAERLRVWLIERHKADTVDVRTIVRLGPNALRETARVRKLVAILESHFWLVPLPGARQVWRIIGQ